MTALPWGRLLATLAAAAALAASNVWAAKTDDSVTFSKHIAPLVFKNCSHCHRPGEVAPFALLSYSDVSKRADQIADIVERKAMPPWKPVAGHGEFLDSRVLSADEIKLLRTWANNNAPEGDAKETPPTPKFTSGWQLGEPDLVVTLPEEYPVPADGRDIYRNFIVPLTVPNGKYIKAVEFRPSNPRVVHHAILSYDKTGIARDRDAADPGPGFTNFSIVGKRLPGSTGIWTPGKFVKPLGEGFSFAWPKDADFLVQLHVHPSGKPEVEKSTIGFYFTEVAPTRNYVDVALIDKKIDIAPGEKNYRTHGELTLPAEVEVHAIFPHMHMLGKDVKVVAELPDGTNQNLFWIDDWNFNWQDYYQYASPVRLPKGTKITMDCVHDNSAENPNNPTIPPKRIRWGEGTLDEMSIVLLEVASVQNPVLAKIGVQQGVIQKFMADASLMVKVDAAMKKFDADGDGLLSLDECVTANGGKQPREAIARFVKRFDKDADEKLNRPEAVEATRALLGQ